MRRCGLVCTRGLLVERPPVCDKCRKAGQLSKPCSHSHGMAAMTARECSLQRTAQLLCSLFMFSQAACAQAAACLQAADLDAPAQQDMADDAPRRNAKRARRAPAGSASSELAAKSPRMSAQPQAAAAVAPAPQVMPGMAGMASPAALARAPMPAMPPGVPYMMPAMAGPMAARKPGMRQGGGTLPPFAASAPAAPK